MKFARYLQDTQAPEWKKAYIDYRGLKKRITAVRRYQEEHNITTESNGSGQIVTESPEPSTVLLRNTSDPEKIKDQSGPPACPTVLTSNPSTGFKHASSTSASKPKIRRKSFISSPPARLSIPINELMPLLSETEREFFTLLDKELEKVETFYLTREKAMMARSEALQMQLQELDEHRERFYATHKTLLESALKPANQFRRRSHTKVASTQAERGAVTPPAHTRTQPDNSKQLDPDEYQQAKKSLRKAVFENYRGLETLNNYRILNVTGLRKALKKFEKTTKIPCQDAYMTERVETSALSSDRKVREMMHKMEEIYAYRFMHGDKKKAMTRLRADTLHKSHHFSTMRTGLMLGLSVPAIISGVYQSLQEGTRAEIPGWDGLLFVFGVLLVPVMFSLLVGLNLLVWARSRINYVFIFELDMRTRMDHREYFETPALLLALLSYAFWLSFSRIGAPQFNPVYWPLVWLGVAAVILLDPFPLLFRPSRFWLSRHVGKLLLSGTGRVEFADFWLGDQFCSLVFTLSNISLFVCSYGKGYDDWRKCGNNSQYWPIALVLGVLPFVIRLVQSIRRYVDSGLGTHLVNGGKYGSGIIAYVFYFLWRHRGGTSDFSFILWCICNSIYCIYALSWDFLMDWSLLRFHVHYPLLREELLYSDHIYLYYFAIITNALFRFAWVMYIPSTGPDFYLRNFLVGVLEVFRRWLWNFFRLENEHIGNMDQYRITREVPLPYSFDDFSPEDDIDDSDGGSKKSRRVANKET